MSKTVQQKNKLKDFVAARKTALNLIADIEHRLELVGTYEGIDYINDSKSSDVDSTYYSLELMNKPVVWIVGAEVQENYEVLAKLVRFKVKDIVCFGSETEYVQSLLGEFVDEFYSCADLNEAISIAKSRAKSGDAVLFSPACTSFEIYENYKTRGEHFRALVKN